MRAHWSLWLFCLVGIAMAAFPLVSCAAMESMDSPRSQQPTPVSSSPGSSALAANSISFSFSDGSQRSSPLYTIHTSPPISKLRHGHAEFTINLAGADKSLIIAFIGYVGPATYTLSNRVNGGDVRISIGRQFWDLSLTPSASCSLTVLSDIPTEQAGLDRMRGNFACPALPPGASNTTPHPVAINDGTFDTLIIVES